MKKDTIIGPIWHDIIELISAIKFNHMLITRFDVLYFLVSEQVTETNRIAMIHLCCLLIQLLYPYMLKHHWQNIYTYLTCTIQYNMTYLLELSFVFLSFQVISWVYRYWWYMPMNSDRNNIYNA